MPDRAEEHRNQPESQSNDRDHHDDQEPEPISPQPRLLGRPLRKAVRRGQRHIDAHEILQCLTQIGALSETFHLGLAYPESFPCGAASSPVSWLFAIATQSSTDSFCSRCRKKPEPSYRDPGLQGSLSESSPYLASHKLPTSACLFWPLRFQHDPPR